MGANALLVSQDLKVQSVMASILAEQSIESELFTDVALAGKALKCARFSAVVVDCDFPGASGLLNLEDSPSNRTAISFAISSPGGSNPPVKAGFTLAKPLKLALVRSTLRVAGSLILSLHRRTFRCGLTTTISLSNATKSFRARTLNISMGGVAIQAAEELASDEHFDVVFSLPDGSEIKSDARVVWTDRLDRAALIFTRKQSPQFAALQNWIDAQIQKSPNPSQMPLPGNMGDGRQPKDAE